MYIYSVKNELTCLHCKAIICSRFNIKFCSRACHQSYNAIHGTPHTYKIIRLANHPLANNCGQVLEHRKVLFDKIGEGEHPCHWCKTPLRWYKKISTKPPDYLTADHVNGRTRENNPENLVPSCKTCNAHRNRRITNDELMVVTKWQRARAIIKECEWCKQSFQTTISNTKRGHGKFCSSHCKMKYRYRLHAKPESHPRPFPLIQPHETYFILSNGKRTRTIETSCQTCQKSFFAIATFVKQGRGKYCSPACMYNRK